MDKPKPCEPCRGTGQKAGSPHAIFVCPECGGTGLYGIMPIINKEEEVMSDTHINAFEAEVADAEVALKSAQANLDAAKLRLANKQAEVETPAEEASETPAEAPAEAQEPTTETPAEEDSEVPAEAPAEPTTAPEVETPAEDTTEKTEEPAPSVQG